MLVYRFDRKGLDFVKKDINKIIGQLKILVKRQRKNMKTIQQACLQMKKANADDMDIFQFYHAAYNAFRNIVEVKYDILLLTNYKKIIDNYREMIESGYGTCDINTDKFVAAEGLSIKIKEKFLSILDVYSIETFVDFRKSAEDTERR